MTAWAEEQDLDTVLLERYCAGTASVQDAARIEAWFQAHPEQRAWYGQLKAVLRQEKFPAMSAAERNAALTEFVRDALARRPEGRRHKETGVPQHFLVRNIRNLIGEVTSQVLALMHGENPHLRPEELERLRTLVAEADDEPDDEPKGPSAV